MSLREYDVVVVGVGGMGSAACYHLARRGQRVLGIEQYDIPHDLGSSHGSSRVIRLAYYEDPGYVPLVRRAYQLWHDLEQVSRERLLITTGGIDLGTSDAEAMRGVLAGLVEHQIPYERLDAAAVRRRFVALSPPDDHIGVFQPDAGFLDPERCTIAHVEGALASGADCRARERVFEWAISGGTVTVTTDRGRYEARRLVVTAGPWLARLLPELGRSLCAERQVQAWFRPLRPADFEVGVLPVFIHHLADRAYYGVPHHGRPGVKICRHHGGAIVDPEKVERTPTRADEEDLRAYIRPYLPNADGPILAMKVCLYTNTPDSHFIIDHHPAHPEVIVAGGFSGHGYKFASVVGEILADLAIEGRTRWPIGAFRMGRLAGP